MLQQVWVDENRRILVCLDSYDDGVPKGWLHSPGQSTEYFSSLSQFLLKVEDMLDEKQIPQAYAPPKTFSLFLKPENASIPAGPPRGIKATFELKVIFRQHTSWQGILLWRERRIEHSFRSVLELVMLMDSALRGLEGCEAV